MKKGKEQGDSLKLFKEERRNYDVIVSNTLTRPRLQFHHPDFIKDYFSNENHYAFPKTENVTNVYDRIAGRGITFAEGINWKKKRNIFNKVFNFDFVKAQTAQIAKICD
jgi:cytochrome P450